jgi:hypothetical protein
MPAIFNTKRRAAGALTIRDRQQDKSKLSLKRKRLKAPINPSFRTELLAYYQFSVLPCGGASGLRDKPLWRSTQYAI